MSSAARAFAGFGVPLPAPTRRARLGIAAVAALVAVRGAFWLLDVPITAEENIFFLSQAMLLLMVVFALPLPRPVMPKLRPLRDLTPAQPKPLADIQGGDGVLRLTATGEVEHVTGAAARLLGLSAAALRGSAFAERIYPEDRGRFTSALDRARRIGEATTCFRMRHASGQDRWIEARMRLVGQPSNRIRVDPPIPCAAVIEGRCHPGFTPPCTAPDWTARSPAHCSEAPILASLRDIHDRRSAELLAANNAAQLRESNRLLTMAEQLASLGHWVFDPVRNQLVLSAEAAAMIGLARLTVDVHEAIRLLDPRDRLPLLRTLAAARHATAPVECTVRLGDANGTRTLQLRMQLRGEAQEAAACSAWSVTSPPSWRTSSGWFPRWRKRARQPVSEVSSWPP